MENKIRRGEFQIDKDFIVFVEKILRGISAEPDDAQKVNLLLDGVVEFYKADRAYVIEGDLEPICAVNAYERTAEGKPFQRDTLEDLPASAYARWAELFLKNETIIIKDMEEIHEIYPDEYAYFAASAVHSLIIVPYSGRLSRGFIGVDNPTRYMENPLALQVLAHIIMELLTEIKLTAKNIALESASAQEADLVKVKLFGNMEITAKGGKLTYKNIPGKGRTILAMMLLDPTVRYSAQTLYDMLSAKEASQDKVGVTIANYIYKIRSALSVINLKDLIYNDDGVYYINPAFRIESDILHFQQLCKKMNTEKDHSKQIEIALEALETYTSPPPLSLCNSADFDTIVLDLETRFLMLATWCTNYYLENGNPEQAYEILLRARKIDSSDIGLILLMIKVMKLGNVPGVKRFAEKVKKNLQNEEKAKIDKIIG